MAIKPFRPGEGEKPASPGPQPPPKSVSRKPGHIQDSPGDNQEENVAEPEYHGGAGHRGGPAERDAEAQKKSKELKRINPDPEERRRRREQPPEEEAPKKSTTPGHLSHDANFHRSQHARKMGFDQSPSVEEIVVGQESEDPGASLGTLLPSAKARGHADLPEVETRPPEFLSQLEAMNDIYLKTKGRLSRKTKELLSGPDLEDLLAMLRTIIESPTLSKSGEARVLGTIHAKLKDDPGPLLLGLNDPRLTEPWRVFLDGWDIWVPKGDGGGVELFWEGEAEDDAGEVIEMTQALSLRNGELTLYTALGEVIDRLTFDGQAYYRLKHEL